MATFFSLPPELLLDILALAGGPAPSEESYERGYQRYLERNRNLKPLTLVHKAWKDSAQKVLQEEVYIRGPDWDCASDEELDRISSLLMESKVGGTKYLTINGHLDEFIAATGYAMWSRVRYLRLWMSRRNDGSTWMRDFTSFPRESFFFFPQHF